MENKAQILRQYQGKVLGVRNYRSDKQEFKISDLTDPEILVEFIVETFTGESDITPAGKAFLEEYYDFKELAATLHENHKFLKTHGHVPLNELQGRLASLIPMETSRFVEEVKGTIQEGATLREDLLPPTKES